MGIDMINIETILLTNGHFDHGDGLQYLAGGKHDIILNGAAARKLQMGDLVIIMPYKGIDSKDYEEFKPKIVYSNDYYKQKVVII